MHRAEAQRTSSRPLQNRVRPRRNLEGGFAIRNVRFIERLRLDPFGCVKAVDCLEVVSREHLRNRNLGWCSVFPNHLDLARFVEVAVENEERGLAVLWVEGGSRVDVRHGYLVLRASVVSTETSFSGNFIGG